MKAKFTLVALALLAFTIAFGQQSLSWPPKDAQPHFIEKVQIRHHPKQMANQNIEKFFPKHPKRIAPRKASTAALKHRLDSIVYNTLVSAGQWAAVSVDKFEYDWLGNLLRYTEYSINGSVRIPGYTIQMQYNSNGDIIEETTQYNYNQSTTSYDDGYKYNTVYNTNHQVIKSIYSDWNSMIQQFEPFAKDTLMYNSAGNESQVISYIKNSGTSMWDTTGKIDYTYDANGNNTEQIFYFWDSSNNQWIPGYKQLYTYSNNGELIEVVSSNYDQNTTTWINGYKTNYTYDANGNLSQDISSSWDINLTAWENNYKGEYSHDANGNQTEWAYSSWDPNQFVWEKDFKETATYDANSNPISYIYSIWDSNLGQWVNGYKTDISFDLTIPSAQVVAGWYGEYNNKLLAYESSQWNQMTNQWDEEDRGTCYYTRTNSIGMVENELSTPTLYPNPTSGKVTVSFNKAHMDAKVSILSIDGRLINTQEVINSTKAEVSLGHQNGLYIIQVKCASAVSTFKVLKE